MIEGMARVSSDIDLCVGKRQFSEEGLKRAMYGRAADLQTFNLDSSQLSEPEHLRQKGRYVCSKRSSEVNTKSLERRLVAQGFQDVRGQ